MDEYKNNWTIGEIEEKYGVDFGVRSDMKVGTLLKKKGHPSLAKIIEGKRKEYNINYTSCTGK